MYAFRIEINAFCSTMLMYEAIGEGDRKYRTDAFLLITFFLVVIYVPLYDALVFV